MLAHRRMTIFALTIFIMVSVFASGCGGAALTPTPTEEPAAGTSPTSTTTEPTPTEAPVQRGVLNMAIATDPVMNPVIAREVGSTFVNFVIFTGLTKPDPVTLQPVPDLADSWTVSEDGLTWTFELRQDVLWHDGEEFDAEDVEFTFDAIFDPEVNSAMRSDLGSVEEVNMVDDYTVEFHLKEPFASLPTYLYGGAFGLGILPKHVLEGADLNTADDFNSKNPIGTGPFMVTEVVAGDHVTLSAFNDFYLGPPNLEKINFKILPDINTQIAQLKTGELDVVLQLEPANLEAVENTTGLVVKSADQPNYFYVTINNDRDIWKDKLVRQAIQYGIDREAIIDSVLFGRGKVATGPISPSLPEYYDDDVTTYPYDLDKALSLLKEAGWEDIDGDGIIDKDGQPFQFTLSVGKFSPVLEQLGVLVHQYFLDLGMDVELELMEWGVWVQDRYVARNYDASIAWWVTAPDPDIYAFYHSSAADQGRNLFMVRDAELDQLLEEGRQTSDPEMRQDIYSRVQEILADEAYVVYLYYPDEIQAWQERVGGVPDTNFRTALRYTQEWFVK